MRENKLREIEKIAEVIKLSAHYQINSQRNGLMIGFAQTDPKRYPAAMAALGEILAEMDQEPADLRNTDIAESGR